MAVVGIRAAWSSNMLSVVSQPLRKQDNSGFICLCVSADIYRAPPVSPSTWFLYHTFIVTPWILPVNMAFRHADIWQACTHQATRTHAHHTHLHNTAQIHTTKRWKQQHSLSIIRLWRLKGCSGGNVPYHPYGQLWYNRLTGLQNLYI